MSQTTKSVRCFCCPPFRVTVKTDPPTLGVGISVVLRMSVKNDHAIIGFTDTNGVVSWCWSDIIRATERDVSLFVMDYVGVDSSAFEGEMEVQVMSQNSLAGAVRAARLWGEHLFDPGYVSRLMHAIWTLDNHKEPTLVVECKAEQT